jgi:ElaB/YqjD/DUF883 family membrane-anchored ribosome-binding protein
MELMESSNRGETQKAMQDLGTAVEEGEASLKNLANDKTGEMRAKLQAAVDRAKATYARLQDRTVAAAKATDKTVREHPYQAIGIAFGLGVLIGVLAMRSRQDD